jgi:hypothetical protein
MKSKGVAQPGKGSSKCKGPEVGMFFVCSRGMKKAGQAGVELEGMRVV